MKKFISVSEALFSIFMVSILVLPFSSFAASSNYEINFKMNSANKSVSYDSTNQILTASNISVDSVTSVNTPLNNGQTLSLTNSVLTFTFDDNNNTGNITLTEKPLGSTSPEILFSGIFTSGTVTQSGNGNGIKTTFNSSFSNNIGQVLASYFGLPYVTGAYQGNTSFTINKTGNFTIDPKSLTNTTSVPLPAAGFLLCSGLIGLICVRRKQTI